MIEPKATRSHLTADPAVPAAVAHFDSELVYQWPLGWRIAIVAFGLTFAAFGCYALLTISPKPGHGADGIANAILAMVIATGLAVSLLARMRWVFGVDGLASREWWRTRALPYAEIASCTVNFETQKASRGPTIRGVRITFRSTEPFATPLSLFVREGYPLDRAMVQRLKTLLPQLSDGELRTLESASLKRLPSE
jgi:hypothetical protein